jgi:beta-glucosidase
MNHNSHRLSIEWSRIEPTEGGFNEEEIEHYRKVLEDLNKRGIKPVVTLWHFTLPHWFVEQGGFLHKDGRLKFLRYARRIVEELGDLVEIWCTINEPFVYAHFGYRVGEWPPGIKSFPKFLKILRELLHVHIDTYQLIKETYKKNGLGKSMVGFAKSFVWFDPYNQKGIINRLVTKIYRYFYNKLYFRPFYTGRHTLLLGGGKIHDAKDSLDYIGVNYYFRCQCKVNFWKNPLTVDMEPSHKFEKSLLNWEVYPEGLYYLTKLISRKLNKPILITENGISTLNDDQRISYIIRHLDAVNRAMAEGADVLGYMYWSFLDNFEWAEGYTQFFGLVSFDHKTFKRTPRPSAQVYSEICKTGTITNAMINKYAQSIKERSLF